MAYRAIIISLHPEYWREIRLGAKLLEIRKTRPRGNGPYTVLVYVTGGVGVVGEFVCDCFYKLDTVPGLPTWALPPQDSLKNMQGAAESPCGAGIYPMCGNMKSRCHCRKSE